jgi:hypothetical protein
MSNTTPSQILFIDSRVPDADVLLAGLDPSIEIVRLNSTESGLQQMARAVEGRSDIASVHVISHGGPGVLALGSSLVNEENLVVEQEALAAFKSALTEDADLLLYGCDVAAGDEGQRFINALAAATGADVAASIDLTGGATPESDWDLESSTGFIETQAIEPTNYQHDLGWWRSVYLTSGDRYAINKGQSYTVRFDADGGGKKGGVDNYSSAYNVSGLYASGYDHGGEIIDFSFRGSSSAVPGSAYSRQWSRWGPPPAATLRLS